ARRARDRRLLGAGTAQPAAAPRRAPLRPRGDVARHPAAPADRDRDAGPGCGRRGARRRDRVGAAVAVGRHPAAHAARHVGDDRARVVDAVQPDRARGRLGRAGRARTDARQRVGVGRRRARGRDRDDHRGAARRPDPGVGAAPGAAGSQVTHRIVTWTLAARGARTRTGALTESPPSTVASTTSWRRVPMPANEPRKTKADRREAARREAERLAAKQKATESRNRIVIAVVSVVVVALVVVAGVLIWRESQRTLLT